MVEQPAAVVDVDFSLAVHNRTGKYFIGRDIIGDHPALIGDIFYARVAGPALPSPLMGKIASRLAAIEMRRRAAGRFYPLPLVRRDRPVLHLDPLTALTHRLLPRDAVLIHDIGPVTHPELFAERMDLLYRAVYLKIAAAAPLCVFVSETSLKAFRRAYDFRGEVRVIYPHVRTDVGGGASRVPGLPDRFLLTVGSIGARKGQQASIRAYARSGLHASGVGYVLCGGAEPPGVAEAMAEAERTPGVTCLPYVTDEQLRWLYRSAAGFVLASRLEGFGMPIAEAMAAGLVPAVSRDSVLEEVAGPGGLFFDPLDEEAIAAAMRTLAAMPRDEADRRRLAMRTQLAHYSRERFTRQWGEVLSGLAGSTAAHDGEAHAAPGHDRPAAGVG